MVDEATPIYTPPPQHAPSQSLGEKIETIRPE